ncbi:MAG: permease-like cell division protein FtsX [Actinobacteria bacterium]|nr:permease-like cell division protein FtsX [Actinomycetota bacterium]MBW3651451.1 permease-like cell division protein FtsX [Actinomycetota bacterium]
MAISVDYVVRETATNLRRNLLMTTAAILTVAVSLSLVGAALLLRQGVTRATLQWQGGVELSIFLNPDIAATQRDAIKTQLDAMPEVRRVAYVDQEAAYAEFKQMFANSPDMVESVSAKDLPPSFRVVPRQPELTEIVGQRFNKREGVKEVVYAEDMVETLINFTDFLQNVIFAVAGVLLLSAALLILNTIRMAIFARRREVAVMKLVGATNWFIRVPFMLEGMVQGLVGAAASFLMLVVSRGLIASALEGNHLIEQFVVSSADVMGTGLFILAMGALVGGAGSALAVSRFLDV